MWGAKACFDVFFAFLSCPDKLTPTAGHWSELGSTTEFRGKLLENCVSIIHQDIIAIWNMQDSSSVRFPQLTNNLSHYRKYLGGQDFRARMSNLVEELASVSENDMLVCFLSIRPTTQ